uniref:CSON011783 protein n=1 Tax=Culicoides sonorensis TaxID=179676 RepID=A0A336M418_CULSO
MSSNIDKNKKKLDRLEKQALGENQRIIKPGECMKYMTVEIDSGCLSVELLGTSITSVLATNQIQYKIRSNLIQHSVIWKRTLPQNLISSSQNELQLSEKIVQEKVLLLLMPAKDFIQHVKSKSLLNEIKTIQQMFSSDYTFELMICGLKSYCTRNRGAVGRTESEFALSEIQLQANCCHRLLESSEEVGQVIQQYTKSIAERPYKEQKAEKYEKENFYLGNDSKDCVRVQNGIGLSRLWQQQLIKLPNVTLEIAEAIISKYPMPILLVEALEKSDSKETLLADLSIRRAGGPLTTNRRIGNELSRKICNLFMNEDPSSNI